MFELQALIVCLSQVQTVRTPRQPWRLLTCASKPWQRYTESFSLPLIAGERSYELLMLLTALSDAL